MNTKKHRAYFRILSCLFAALLLLRGGEASIALAGRLIEAKDNPYSSFSVPTQVCYFGNTFFLVDSYHGQVITSGEAGLPPKQWKVMDAVFDGPHAIAWDGEVYMVADTDNNRVVTYRKSAEGFEQLQVFPGIGIRPHYVTYEADEGLFYVWSSMTGEMFLFRRDPTPGSLLVWPEEVRTLPELRGSYVRSFTVEGDTVYLPSVNLACICAVDRKSFGVKKIYPVADEIAGIIQITKVEDMYYITVSTDRGYDQSKACFIRTPSLEALSPEVRGYEVITDKTGGVPYYLTRVGNSWYAPMPKADGRSSILRFDVFMHQLVNVREYAF